MAKTNRQKSENSKVIMIAQDTGKVMANMIGRYQSDDSQEVNERERLF